MQIRAFIDNAFAYTYEANTTADAVVTSIDRNKVTLNGATVALDNMNREEAVVESNRQMDLRRGFTQATPNIPDSNVEETESVYATTRSK